MSLRLASRDLINHKIVTEGRKQLDQLLGSLGWNNHVQLVGV